MRKNRSLGTILTLFSSILLLLILLVRPCLSNKATININDPEARKMVMAKIGDKPITLDDVIKFGKSSPTYYGFLEIPNGPDRLLKELVLQRLLLLEGKDRKIPEPSDHNESLYLIRIKKELLPPIPPITEEEAKKYYETHKKEFSTPLFLRLSQIKIYFNGKNRDGAYKLAMKAMKELHEGKDFAKVARKYSQEPISAERGGDIGFVPDSSLSPKEAKKQILALKKGQVSQILKIGKSFTIVKLTDKREPITDPFDRVKDIAKEKAEKARQKARIEKLRKELERKWKVTYMDK